MSQPLNPNLITVALLAGGASGERDISLASGAGAKEALESAGFNVVVFDPVVKADLKELVEGHFDVAFICLHGRYGEDGTVQGLLEILGIPYIGSGVWASALAMDKAKAKVFYRHHGVATPMSLVVDKTGYISNEEIKSQVGLPCVVKPASEGSALGVHIVHTAEELETALEQTLALNGEALVETYIKGMELTVSVLGNDFPEALPVIEIIPKNGFYDFESKYAPGGSQHICPARLSEEDTARVQALAVKAHKALGCRGVSRTDIIMDEQGKCWVLETNTVPGMTSTSLLPDSARAAGLSFPQLCTKLIELALETPVSKPAR